MVESRPWPCMSLEERNYALLDAILEGQPRFISPPPLDTGKKASGKAEKGAESPPPEPAALELCLAAARGASPRDIVEHLASESFGAFYGEWKARADLAAQRYAGLVKPALVLLAVPDVSAKAGLAAKDGVKLMDDIVREQPLVDPAADISDATVERAAEVVRANSWKVAGANTPPALES